MSRDCGLVFCVLILVLKKFTTQGPSLGSSANSVTLKYRDPSMPITAPDPALMLFKYYIQLLWAGGWPTSLLHSYAWIKKELAAFSNLITHVNSPCCQAHCFCFLLCLVLLDQGHGCMLLFIIRYVYLSKEALQIYKSWSWCYLSKLKIREGRK